MQQQPEKKKIGASGSLFTAGYLLLITGGVAGMTGRTVIGFMVAGLGFLCIAAGLILRQREKKKDVIQDR